jgi:hypothetical protein
MSAANVLLKLEECVMLLVDFQAGLGFGVESIPRQLVVNNAVGSARTAVTFKVPIIASSLPQRRKQGTAVDSGCGCPHGSLCIFPGALSAEGWLRSVGSWRRLRRLDPTKP